jgi:hypothetical protein
LIKDTLGQEHLERHNCPVKGQQYQASHISTVSSSTTGTTGNSASVPVVTTNTSVEALVNQLRTEMQTNFALVQARLNAIENLLGGDKSPLSP